MVVIKSFFNLASAKTLKLLNKMKTIQKITGTNEALINVIALIGLTTIALLLLFFTFLAAKNGITKF